MILVLPIAILIGQTPPNTAFHLTRSASLRVQVNAIRWRLKTPAKKMKMVRNSSENGYHLIGAPDWLPDIGSC
jgi:hypothetical protein